MNAPDSEHDLPALSVILTVVSGLPSVRRTLSALAPIAGDVEILVPVESERRDVLDLAAQFPGVRFLDLGVLPLDARNPGPEREHECYDRRRAAGVLASRGSVIAILEDHGTPAPGWAEAVIAAHRRLPHAAIGGVVTNAIHRPRQDALWLCDFHRYAPPRPPGPTNALTDVNVSYKRPPLFALKACWHDRYHEPVVHSGLLQGGEILWLDPQLVIAQERPERSLGALVAERYAWGRLFGVIRAGILPRYASRLMGVAALALPPLLLWRILRSAPGRIPFGRLLRALPWLSLLVTAWSVGESAGCLRGRSRDSLP